MFGGLSQVWHKATFKEHPLKIQHMSSGFTKLTFIIKLIYFTFFLSLKKKRKCIHNDIQNNLVSLKLSQESMIFRTIDRIVYMVQYCKYIFHLRFLLICRWVSQLISFEERKKCQLQVALLIVWLWLLKWIIWV